MWMLEDAFMRRLSELRGEIDARLAALTPERGPSVLREAIGYALLSPGKRLRPTLSLLAAEHFGPVGAPPAYVAAALDAGCAIEMVHAASLVLDDLPCMDDAAVRRGRATCHRRFGEDIAVLAAVALLNQAYATLAACDLPAATRLALVARLGDAVGLDGLVAGQARDLRERGGVADAGLLHDLNRQKTGVLFVASVEAGAAAAGATGARLEGARRFAGALGEAFQILDDLTDAVATCASAGKDVRQDGAKPTVVSLVGPEAALGAARRRLDEALDHLAEAGPGPLSRFAEALFGTLPAVAA